jgi:hypothetical protein
VTVSYHTVSQRFLLQYSESLVSLPPTTLFYHFFANHSLLRTFYPSVGWQPFLKKITTKQKANIIIESKQK